MSKYTSKPVVIDRPVESVYSSISDIQGYQEKLDSLPEEAKAKIGDVKFTEDTITISTQPVGEICFRVVEKKEPSRIVLESEQSPVPLKLSVDMKGLSEGQTEIKSEIDVDIPLFLRPMVGGKLQEAADQFSNLIKTFFA